MLTELYIEALLVDEELADQVWDAGMITDDLAGSAWCIIVVYQWLTFSGDGKEDTNRVRGQNLRQL